jgi:hypothetical protein
VKSGDLSRNLTGRWMQTSDSQIGHLFTNREARSHRLDRLPKVLDIEVGVDLCRQLRVAVPH